MSDYNESLDDLSEALTTLIRNIVDKEIASFVDDELEDRILDVIDCLSRGKDIADKLSNEINQ